MAVADGRGTLAREPARFQELLGSDGYAERLVRWKGREAARRPGLDGMDRGDIEQELWLDLLQRAPRFDPERGSVRGFVRGVVDHRLASLLRAQAAAVRGGCCRRESLHNIVEGEEDSGRVERGETLDEESQRRRSGAAPRDEATLRDLRIDIEAALATLPPDLRDLARRLAYYTPAEAARSTGVPRTTLYRRIRRLRAHLQRAGLAEYLPDAGSSR